MREMYKMRLRDESRQDYPFSSLHALYAEMGRGQLLGQFRTYHDDKTLVLHEAHKDDF